jgi:hypothetical protein
MLSTAYADGHSTITIRTDHDWTVQIGGATFGLRGYNVMSNVDTNYSYDISSVIYGDPADSSWLPQSKLATNIRAPFAVVASVAVFGLLFLGLVLIVIVRSAAGKLTKPRAEQAK